MFYQLNNALIINFKIFSKFYSNQKYWSILIKIFFVYINRSLNTFYSFCNKTEKDCKFLVNKHKFLVNALKGYTIKKILFTLRHP